MKTPRESLTCHPFLLKGEFSGRKSFACPALLPEVTRETVIAFTVWRLRLFLAQGHTNSKWQRHLNPRSLNISKKLFAEACPKPLEVS
jgi:hypothetical protein